MFRSIGDDDAESLNAILGIDAPGKETEMERMIRTGELTPFGTTAVGCKVDMTPFASETKLNKPSTSEQLSDFELYLLDQGKKSDSGQKNKRVKIMDKGCPKTTEQHVMENTTSQKFEVEKPLNKSFVQSHLKNVSLDAGTSTKHDVKHSDSELGVCKTISNSAAKYPDVNNDLVNLIKDDIQTRQKTMGRRKHCHIRYSRKSHSQEFDSDEEWKPDNSELYSYDPDDFYHPGNISTFLH